MCVSQVAMIVKTEITNRMLAIDGAQHRMDAITVELEKLHEQELVRATSSSTTARAFRSSTPAPPRQALVARRSGLYGVHGALMVAAWHAQAKVAELRVNLEDELVVLR